VGFIGSHLVRVLIRTGHQVRVLDNLSTSSLENLADVLDTIEFVRGDVRDYRDAESAVRGIALIDVAESVEKPDLYFDVNVRGTYNVVKASKNVSTFVFASSSAVYGEPIRVPNTRGSPFNAQVTIRSQQGIWRSLRTSLRQPIRLQARDT